MDIIETTGSPCFSKWLQCYIYTHSLDKLKCVAPLADVYDVITGTEASLPWQHLSVSAAPLTASLIYFICTFLQRHERNVA